MELTANFKIEEEYIPPRCRKPRLRTYEGKTTVDIPVVTPKDAPVALSHMEGIRHTDNYYKVDYRWYNGQLYAREREFSGAKNLGFVTLAKFKKTVQNRFLCRDVRDENCCYVHNVEQACACVKAEFAKIILLDTGRKLQVWAQKEEPRYDITTFGLGHNHGGIGTWLSICNHYNPNIPKERYFNALQFKEAQKEALRIAKLRGDDKSYGYIRTASQIRVLIPEAVRCKPAEEAGDGNDFIKELETLIEGSNSAQEAGILVSLCAVRN